jgi:hypothetical protein
LPASVGSAAISPVTKTARSGSRSGFGTKNFSSGIVLSLAIAASRLEAPTMHCSAAPVLAATIPVQFLKIVIKVVIKVQGKFRVLRVQSDHGGAYT